MDIETATYIINYYHQFFNEQENKALRHIHSLIKLEGEVENSPRYRVYKRKGWVTSDKEVLELVKKGEDVFFINTAIRILKEYKEKVFLNCCPKCKKLARTPRAKQCRYCNNKWFDNVTN
ncbi:conserved hypothetical protein [Tenacibaculum sp. 190524A02b]|uniref:Uncharacterized protein n=1 Tax=Tenacibaculum vairaonense TaxID=3137860 RepID=A0ABM9PRM0_9FLAO